MFSSSYKTKDSELFTGFLPDGYIFQSRNANLNAKVVATALSSHHVHKVSMIMEQLYAETTILHQEYAEMKSVIDTQKERNSGKWKLLKDDRVVARPDVVEASEGAKRIAKQRGQRNNKTIHHLMEASYLPLKWNTVIRKMPWCKGSMSKY